MNKNFETICINGRMTDKDFYTHRLPIYYSNTYKGKKCYARYWNPNRSLLEQTFLKIYSTPSKKVQHCNAVSSGLGAFSALLSSMIEDVPQKDVIIVDKYMYSEVRDVIRYFRTIFDIIYINTNNTTELLNALSDRVIGVITDACPFPTFNQMDIPSICKTVHMFNPVIPVIVDNSNPSCYCYNPFVDGADIVIESLGKYCCGHGDVMGGVILNYNVASSINVFGNGIDAQSAWLISRSLSTMKIRMDKALENADKVYDFLQNETKIEELHRCAAVITFLLPHNCACQNDFLTIKRKIFHHFKLIRLEYSFGQDNTVGMVEQFTKKNYIRLAIGLEDADDIIQDLRNVFERISLLK